MPTADTKNIDGKTYFHETNEYFTNKQEAQIHQDRLSKDGYLVRIQKRTDGTYWVWWGRK